MDERDDHVISFEEASRRRRAAEEAQKNAAHEVQLSDAMSRLLEEEGQPEDGDLGDGVHGDGPSPDELRRIVERDFAEKSGRSSAEPEDRPRPHLVSQSDEETGGQVCSFETGRCWDPDEFPDGPPPE